MDRQAPNQQNSNESGKHYPVSEFVEAHDSKQKADALMVQAGAKMAAGDLAGARTDYETALLIFSEEGGSKHDVGMSIVGLANSVGALGDNTQAVLWGDKAVNIFRRIGFRKGEALALAVQGKSIFDPETFSFNLAACWQAQKIFQELDDSLAQTFVELFEKIRSQKGDSEWQELIANLSAHAEVIRRWGVAKAEAAATLNEGQQLIKDGAWQRGLTTLRYALELFRKLSDPDGKARTFLEIGEAQLLFGDYEMAQLSFRDAERLFRKLGREEGVALAHLKLGTLALYMYQPDEAQTHLQAATSFFHAHGDAKRAEISDQMLKLVGEYETAQFLEV